MTGRIIVEQAYAQGKMLDHSGWDLPRGSLSDMDAIVTQHGIIQNSTFMDNNGRMLFIEFSSKHKHWAYLDEGQRRGYASIVRIGKGQVFAALAYHQVPINKQIKSAVDVISYQLMYWDGHRIQYGDIRDGEDWTATMKKLVFESN